MSRRNAFAAPQASATPLSLVAAAGRSPKASGFSIRKLPHPTEHQEQCAVIEWARLQQGKWPDLALLYAIPNAGAGAQRGQAGKMKAEGVKPGVPDLCLAVRRKGFGGLYIEMKRVGGKLSPEQFGWLAALSDQRYFVATAYGAQQAIVILSEYLKRPK